MKEMYFFHSFPYPNGNLDVKEMKKKGIKILNSMVDIGFLLTPEKIEWNKHLNTNDKLNVNQKRFCMTYIEPSELEEHTKKFGIFSLQFDERVIENLGAMPVFYVPSVQITKDKRIFPSQYLVINLLLTNQFLKKERKQYVPGMNAILGLLCPTEYEYRGEKQRALENFELREWRITGNTVRFLQSQGYMSPDLTEEEKEKITKINPNWCTQKNTTPLKLREFKKQHVLSFAKYLIAPDDDHIINESRAIIERIKGSKKPEVISFSGFQQIYEIDKN
jgi:hypothetical protein